jgi:hypothetical protein
MRSWWYRLREFIAYRILRMPRVLIVDSVLNSGRVNLIGGQGLTAASLVSVAGDPQLNVDIRECILDEQVQEHGHAAPLIRVYGKRVSIHGAHIRRLGPGELRRARLHVVR